MFHGHDIKQWDHYRTPRTCPGFEVDRSHFGDRFVFKVAMVVALFLMVIW